MFMEMTLRELEGKLDGLLLGDIKKKTNIIVIYMWK